MFRDADIDAAAEHQAKPVDIVEFFRCQAVIADQDLEKWREMFAPESNFRTDREVIEFGVINAVVQSALVAAPMATGVSGQTKPAAEIVGEACPHAMGI